MRLPNIQIVTAEDFRDAEYEIPVSRSRLMHNVNTCCRQGTAIDSIVPPSHLPVLELAEEK
jgi:hypothetical protein